MPKDKHPPAFRFYVDDFISDSAVDAMTNEELGIYVRLLCKAWKESPVGTVPADDKILANWAKASPLAWKRCKDGVLRAFVAGDDGRYHQKRMKLEWQKALDYHESKRAAGAKGSQSRWHGDGTANSKGIAQPMAEGMANDGISSSCSSSCSVSKTVDGDGARAFSLGEESEIRAKANRIAKFVTCRKSDDRNLVAKIAVLWQDQALSDDDVEQVLESFSRQKKPITNHGAWLHRCIANRFEKRGQDFAELLASTAVPISLLIQPGMTER